MSDLSGYTVRILDTEFGWVWSALDPDGNQVDTKGETPYSSREAAEDAALVAIKVDADPEAELTGAELEARVVARST